VYLRIQVMGVEGGWNWPWISDDAQILPASTNVFFVIGNSLLLLLNVTFSLVHNFQKRQEVEATLHSHLYRIFK
jgi:hypothetical protein